MALCSSLDALRAVAVPVEAFSSVSSMASVSGQTLTGSSTGSKGTGRTACHHTSALNLLSARTSQRASSISTHQPSQSLHSFLSSASHLSLRQQRRKPAEPLNAQKTKHSEQANDASSNSGPIRTHIEDFQIVDLIDGFLMHEGSHGVVHQNDGARETNQSSPNSHEGGHLQKEGLVSVDDKHGVQFNHHVLAEGLRKEETIARGEETKVSEEVVGSEGLGNKAAAGSVVLGAILLVMLVGIATAGVVFKDDINDAVTFFTEYIEGTGPAGYLTFLAGYTALEILAVPALPLTMSAGLIFGTAQGTLLCSAGGTVAATISFLIARYAARERLLAMVKGNKKFLAIDQAIGEKSFRIVTLLRLSPLLPFALGNYIYGLTSVRLWPYVLGSWIGMLPGTFAYVSAGALGRSLLEAEDHQAVLGSSPFLAFIVGIAITGFAATYVTKVAKDAVKDIE